MKIGVLGAGQLARMLALAGYPLGIELICIDPNKDSSAKNVTNVIHADYSDLNEINKHFHDVDCVTYETENLPIDAIQSIAKKYKLLPNFEALKITQDRLLEKEFINSLQIPTTSFYEVNCWDDLIKGIETFDYPAVLKTRKNGYDGKGQALIHNLDEAKLAWERLSEWPLILEKYITFDNEVSIISVRSHTGEIHFYPLISNQHKNGILLLSQTIPVENNLYSLAKKYASKVLEKLHYVGVMTIEFFCLNGNLIVNEIAPRVHNSGHWTIEGADCSQFENHLRAILELPIGSTQARGLSALINLISTYKNPQELLKIPGLHYHSYQKLSKENRKIGHITLCTQDIDQLNIHIKKVIDYLG